MKKTDNKWKEIINLLAALATIGALAWAVFAYIVPPNNEPMAITTPQPPTPEPQNPDHSTAIKLLERELDGIEKLKVQISELTQSINKLSQGTCQEKNMARKLYNQRNELETELSNKEKNYNHQASNFNLPHISESNISPYKITYISPLDCE